MTNGKIVLRDDVTKEVKVLNVKSLDALASEAKIVTSVVAAATDRTVTDTDLEVTSLQKHRSSKVSTIKAPPKIMNAIMSKSKINISIVTSKITERINSVFCSKCWEPRPMA
ncbi:hypothetical protein TcasGA2_TC011498 [Tribolium castaneum]|uniref:Uncharacterized protein n=1 Tax=Tribolium castaneum TaxID=7070 RepID=D7ELG7_TRICA|nr:hypothetical protein TcasGA2_TC011498 [Tribolium castaneum]